MDSDIKKEFKQLKAIDKEAQYNAYLNILKATDKEVDWAYDVWDQLIEDLTDPDNHQRSRAAQFLANLAKSDPQQRMLNDFQKIWDVTYDERFVTARHTLQSIWKVGLESPKLKEMVITEMAHRFKNCTDEKNYTLIRSDIIQNMKKLYDRLNDEEIKQTTLDLIEIVEDKKYKKTYLNIWN